MGMPRSIWKGVMSFGMVAIPVRLYLATESSSKVSFNLLCPEHRSRIKNKRWCVEGDHEVAWGDVVRGYEYEKGSYVELTDEDLDGTEDVEVAPAELKMAENLVGMMATAFEPSEYKDEYKQAVLKLVEAKVQKKEVIEAPEPEAETTVVDLMSALKASVEKAKKSGAKTKAASSGSSSRTARKKAS